MQVSPTVQLYTDVTGLTVLAPAFEATQVIRYTSSLSVPLPSFLCLYNRSISPLTVYPEMLVRMKFGAEDAISP